MPMGTTTVCPHCGRDYTKNRQFAGVLPPFTVLNKRYILGRVLGKGGFGITYIAKDMSANRICAVKEYMPSEYSSRNGTQNIVPFADDKAQFVFNHGREKFMQEAKTLFELRDNPMVVNIYDFFNQNNTAYLVMEFLDGFDLRGLAKQNGGKLAPDFAKMVFVTVASALMEIHRLGILHRDLSPENIIVTRDGRVALIDFGAARSFVSSQNKGMSILLKPGFAPPEQYNAKGTHGPWSDVYALCATFYTLVSGKPLVDALFRYRGQNLPSLAELGCPVSKKTSDVIERGMALECKDRYKDFKALLDEIDIGPQKPPQGDTPKPSQLYVANVSGNSLSNKMLVNTNDIFKIGRSDQSCQFVVAGDNNISRIHCYVRFDGKNIYLCDASSNGTFFEDGTRLIRNKEYPVKPGTKFYLATKNHMLVLGI